MLEVNEERRKKIVVKNIRGISLDKVTRKARGKREEKIAIKISIKFFFVVSEKRRKRRRKNQWSVFSSQ